MLWNAIRGINGCVPVQPNGSYGTMFLLPVPPDETNATTHWLIGQYKDQTRFATNLRTSPDLQDFLGTYAVRLGLRKSDVAPKDVDRQPRYGNFVQGANFNTNFSAKRVHQLSQPVRNDLPSSNRISDRKENVLQFWATQTPQSHHIVEFNHLRDIGVSKESGVGEMDHGQLPCVLLAAEFHQRYISSILKQVHGKRKEDLVKVLMGTYSKLYNDRGVLFNPLWKVAELILHAAGIK